MAVPFRSIDDALSNDNAQGSLTRCISFPNTGAGTAALTTCGYESWHRVPQSFTVPTFTGNAYMTYCRFGLTGNSIPVMAAIETVLGTLTVSSNAFSSGSTMPTRTIGGGSSAQLAATQSFLFASAALTATTPTITTTYTDEAGNTGNTCTMVLPTSPAINSAFPMQPHLASGDSGVRAVTNMSKSAGTVGTLQAIGLLPLHYSIGLSPSLGVNDSLAAPQELYPIQSGDVISFWLQGTTSVSGVVVFQLQAEV